MVNVFKPHLNSNIQYFILMDCLIPGSVHVRHSWKVTNGKKHVVLRECVGENGIGAHV